MNDTLRRSLAVWSGVAIGFGGLSAGAQEPEAFIEEIYVTAQKREQTLQEVPVAVSVVGNETIEQAQVFDVFDLQTLVPSLRVTQLQSSANTNFLIRGFGNGANNPGIEPSVGVFIDGVYRSRSAAAISDLPNVERIEVLRGPQSTLFGKNASAGVISVITALPDTEFGGSIEAVAGNYGQVIVKGDVDIPLSDNAGFSLAAGSNQRDGYYDNLADGSDFNDRDRLFFRAQLALTPRDNLSLRFIGDYDEIDEKCCGASNIFAGITAGIIQAVGGNLNIENPYAREDYYNVNPFNMIENSGISMQADLDIGEMTLTSITALRNVNRIEDIDADFTSADLIQTNFSETDIDTFTQELRLSGGTDNVDWLVGLFYFDEEVSYDTELTFGEDTRLYADLLISALGGTIPPVPGTLAFLETSFGAPVGSFFFGGIPGVLPPQGVQETTGQDNQATSIFAQVDWHFSDRATLTLGVNHTQDEKDAFVGQANSNLFSQIDFVYFGFLSALQQLEMMDPGNPANVPTAQAISTNPCPPAGALPCNSLLALQPLQVLPPFVDFPNSVESGSSDDSDTTWTARIAVDVTDNVNVYASASTGFKATSWNLSRDSRPFAADIAAIQAASPAVYPFPLPPGINVPNLVAGTRFAGPEESTVYELGVKARFDRGSLNVAVFDQTIEGFQSNVFGGTGFNLANAGKQSTVGVEFDGTYFPTDALQLTLAATWLDPEYDSFVGAFGPNGPTDLSGQQPAGIHELSATATATYSIEFANGMTGFIRGEYIHESDVQVVDNVLASIASREVGLLNASFGLQTEGGWEAILWGRNLTDDEFLLSAFPSVFQEGSLSGYPNAPLTYGLTLRKSF